MENELQQAKDQIDATEMRKANPDIGFRIIAGRMTFLTRKIYNSFVFRAQELGEKGKGVLPCSVNWDLESHGINAGLYYWMPLGQLVADVAVTSENSKGRSGVRSGDRTKKFLQELMSVIVERTAVGWEIQHMLQSARLINTAAPELADRKQRAGKLLVGWRFPDEIEKKILKPDEYTRMSLYYQGRLKTEQGLVLYEICKRYATNPGKVTMRKPWEEWYERMMGVSAGSSGLVYKNFKRRALATAIKEVNALNDIYITIVEHKKPGTKAVAELQFVVEQVAQRSLELTDNPVINVAMLDALDDLGFSPAATEKLLLEHGEEKVFAAAKYTKERMLLTTADPIKTPKAYFQKALSEDYSSQTKELKEAMAAERAEKAMRDDVARKKRMEESAMVTKRAMEEQEDVLNKDIKMRALARAEYDSLADEERKALVAEYLETLVPVLAKPARLTLAGNTWENGDKDGKLFLAWIARKLAVA